jgi:hypothetical protein
MTTSLARKIMLIRHAEKPDGKDAPYGVTPDGVQDAESLTVRGWQRAGALAVLFAPAQGALQNPGLARPDVLFASGVAKHSKSERPEETLIPLSQKLGGAMNRAFDKNQLAALVDAVCATPGTVLICWQHEDIPAIANLILGNQTSVPQQWPADRFDVVWVLDLDDANGLYRFSQVPQRVLPGDQDTGIIASS